MGGRKARRMSLVARLQDGAATTPKEANSQTNEPHPARRQSDSHNTDNPWTVLRDSPPAPVERSAPLRPAALVEPITSPSTNRPSTMIKGDGDIIESCPKVPAEKPNKQDRAEKPNKQDPAERSNKQEPPEKPNKQEPAEKPNKQEPAEKPNKQETMEKAAEKSMVARHWTEMADPVVWAGKIGDRAVDAADRAVVWLMVTTSVLLGAAGSCGTSGLLHNARRLAPYVMVVLLCAAAYADMHGRLQQLGRTDDSLRADVLALSHMRVDVSVLAREQTALRDWFELLAREQTTLRDWFESVETTINQEANAHNRQTVNALQQIHQRLQQLDEVQRQMREQLQSCKAATLPRIEASHTEDVERMQLERGDVERMQLDVPRIEVARSEQLAHVTDLAVGPLIPNAT
jgi:hypothetical protein